MGGSARSEMSSHHARQNQVRSLWTSIPAAGSLSSPAVRAASGARRARRSRPRAAVSRWCPAPPISTSRARRSRDATTRPISATAPMWGGLRGSSRNVDILVNNAGAIPGGTLFDVDEARWRTAWDLKVLGTINMTRAFYPLMKARSGGAIINVIGNAARTHDPDYICGVTGNAGLTAFTEAIGSGSMRDGIRVNGVSPGPTATDRLVNLAGRKAQERFGDPARWPELCTSLPAGRVGQPAEV